MKTQDRAHDTINNGISGLEATATAVGGVNERYGGSLLNIGRRLVGGHVPRRPSALRHAHRRAPAAPSPRTPPPPRSSISNLWPAGRPVIPSPHPTAVVIYHPPPPYSCFSVPYAAPRLAVADNPKTASKVIPTAALTLCARECLCFAFCLFAFPPSFSLIFSLSLSLSFSLSFSLTHSLHLPTRVRARSHTYIIPASTPVKRKATGTAFFSPFFLFPGNHHCAHTRVLQYVYVYDPSFIIRAINTFTLRARNIVYSIQPDIETGSAGHPRKLAVAGQRIRGRDVSNATRIITCMSIGTRRRDPNVLTPST
jgi:hypothetical protein